MKEVNLRESPTTLLGISGHIGSGKDLVGQIIQYLVCLNNDSLATHQKDFSEFCLAPNSNRIQSGWQIKKYADKLKGIVCLLIGCTRSQLENRGFKETPLSKEWWYYKGRNGSLIPYIEDRMRSEEDLVKLTPRLLLQLLGTDCGRQIIHPQIWCNALFADYPDEKWKDIPGYENKFQASTKGRIRSLDREIAKGGNNQKQRFRKGQLLTPSKSGNYLNVGLEGETKSVHVLVAKTWISDLQGEGLVVNHKDFNPENNNYLNLEWCYPKDNVHHNKKHLVGNFGTKQKDAKLTEDDVREIRKLLSEGELSQSKIATKFNISKTTISEIKHKKKWSHVDEEIPKIVPITDDVNWVVTDVRFPNEAQAIKDRGGIIIRVDRDTTINFKNKVNKELQLELLSKQHESETALDNYQFDYVIENNGTIEELIEKVKEILIKEKVL